ncbi:hypothetical protein ACFV20_23250 [Streptomyces sp. NPDC059696]|uniref:hypothetical protein n=1 Tax=Streptomyces sp. NPDC059696 TaxID=3346911 RepID=UPI00368E7955
MTGTTLPEGAAEALEPVRAQLLAAARAEARALVSAADEEAAAVLREGEARVQEIHAAARGHGEADAAAVRAATRVRSRRAARARELAARREAWEELRRQVVRDVGRLRDSEDYPGLRDRLTAYVRGVLGPEARVSEAADGGVVGERAGRRIDMSLTSLADRLLERAAREVEELWAP